MIVIFLLAFVVGIVLTIVGGSGRNGPAGVLEREPESAGAGATGGDLRRLLAQLARVETARLLRHPVFLAGVALSAYILVFAGVRHTRHYDPVTLTGPALIPLAGSTFLAVNLAGIRDRRSGTEELYASMPALSSARTLAHLASVVSAVLVGALMLGIADVLIWVIGGPIPGWNAGPVDLVQGPLAIASAGALGVVFARWIATPVGVLLAPLGVGFLVVGTPFGAAALPFLPVHPGADVGWHVLFMTSFVVLACSAALLRHIRRIPLELLAGGALASAVATGIQQAGVLR